MSLNDVIFCCLFVSFQVIPDVYTELHSAMEESDDEPLVAAKKSIRKQSKHVVEALKGNDEMLL